MKRLRVATLVLCLSALPASAQVPECPEPPSAATSGCARSTDPEHTFYLCHKNGTYWSVAKTAEWKPLPAGGTLRVPSGKTAVEVIETNTAVFDYALTSEAVDAPEAKRLDAFLKKFGPYLTDVLSTELRLRGEEFERAMPEGTLAPLADDLEAFFNRIATVAAVVPGAIENLEEALRNLNAKLDEIRVLEKQVLRAYGNDEAEDLQKAIEGICADEKACRDLIRSHLTDLLAKYDDIEAKLAAARKAEAAIRPLLQQARDMLDERAQARAAEVEEAQRQGKQLPASTPAQKKAEEALAKIRALIPKVQANLDELPKLFATAREALDDSTDVLEKVRILERLLFDGLEACSTWTSPRFPITLQKGRKVTLKITPRPVASLAAAGHLPSVATDFTLQPIWPVQPAVGLSLLYAEGATFSEFGTAKRTVTVDGAEVERFEIVEKEIEDHRFEYGLTLSLTREQRCWNDGRNCPWLDLTVNPSDNVRALGAGLSVNFGRLRVGAGAVWTKHDTLEGGLALGDLLAAEGDLKTGESYDNPDFYVAFSVTGWQPFVSD